MASKHRRATAIVIHDGKVLLVRERGQTGYSLPGGSINDREPTVSAAARELYEETGLHVTEVKRLFSHEGRVLDHQVCLVRVTDGQIKLSRDKELDYAEWWDGKGTKETLPHVRAILGHRGIPFPRRNWLVRLFRRLLFLGP